MEGKRPELLGFYPVGKYSKDIAIVGKVSLGILESFVKGANGNIFFAFVPKVRCW
jgi:hypothetical protein